VVTAARRVTIVPSTLKTNGGVEVPDLSTGHTVTMPL